MALCVIAQFSSQGATECRRKKNKKQKQKKTSGPVAVKDLRRNNCPLWIANSIQLANQRFIP